MTDPSPAESKVHLTHSREELIATLSGIAEIYLAPYCYATRRLHRWLAQELPHIKVLGFLDSYKQDKVQSIWRIGEDEIDESARIVVALERPHIREDVIANIRKHVQSSIIEICSLDFHCSSAAGAASNAKVLYHVYDLGRLPNNYEFFYSLVLAERERRRRGCTGIVTLLVNDDQSNLLYQYDRETRIASQDGGLEVDQGWFMQQVLIPGLDLIPSSCGYQILGSQDLSTILAGVDSRQIFNCSIGEWAIAEPFAHYARLTKQGEDLRYLQAPRGAREAVKQWLNSRTCRVNRLIVITLREASYSQERNSCIPAWRLVAKQCEINDLDVVYIRDTFADFKSPLDFPGAKFSVGAWNLPLRFALYEAAAGNLAVNTGPAAIALLSKATKIAIFVYHDNLSRCYERSAEYNSKNQISSDGVMQALIHGNLSSSEFMIKEMQQLIQYWLD